jgi:hypothetical protein
MPPKKEIFRLLALVVGSALTVLILGYRLLNIFGNS